MHCAISFLMNICSISSLNWIKVYPVYSFFVDKFKNGSDKNQDTLMIVNEYDKIFICLDPQMLFPLKTFFTFVFLFLVSEKIDFL